MSDEVSPGGSQVHRHAPRADGFVPAVEADHEAITAHVERTIGPVKSVLHELVSENVHLDVLWVEATSERPFHVLVTCGMSARPMTLPDGVALPPFAELALLLPADWPMGDEAWRDEAAYWPVRWLKIVARLPHDYATWLHGGHTIPNGDPPQPFASGTRMSGFMLVRSFSLAPESASGTLSDGRPFLLWTLWAVDSDELTLKLEQGAQVLAEKLYNAGVTEVIAPQRPSVAPPAPRRGWLPWSKG